MESMTHSISNKRNQIVQHIRNSWELRFLSFSLFQYKLAENHGGKVNGVLKKEMQTAPKEEEGVSPVITQVCKSSHLIDNYTLCGLTAEITTQA